MSQTEEDDTDQIITGDDPESRFFLPALPPVRVEFGGLSHTGKVRPNNEDHFMILRLRRSLSVVSTNLPAGQLAPPADEDAYAMIVADGMGGAASGEVASIQAIRVAIELILRGIKWTMKLNERESRELVEKFGVYVRLIDRALLESSRADSRLAGMGTTLAAACTVGPAAYIVHAGDSRVYLFRGGKVHRLTRDHTLGQDLIDSGKVPAGSAAALRVGHVLTNYLGGPGGGGKAEVYHLGLADGDRLMVCTDGLTDLVGDVEIGRTLSQYPEPRSACRALVDLALGRGGRDNVTVVLGSYTIPVTEASPSGPGESS